MKRPSDREERDNLQYQAERTSPGKSPSVFVYLAVLAGVAFFLLLMAYFMQQRTNEAALNSLQLTSNSAVESLENLVAERDELRDQLDELADRLAQQDAAFQSQLDDAEREVVAARTAAQTGQDRVDAMTKLNLLRSLYNKSRRKEARAYLAEWDLPAVEAELQAVRDQLTEEERAIYDPLDAFRSLVEWLS